MKTHQEKLNELTTEIRKSIPILMELSEGCEIISKIEDYFNNIEIESNFIIGKNAEFDGEDIVIGEYCYGTINFTIIGHEPLLNHVLKWLDTNKCGFSIRKGGFVFYRMDYLCMANWDLSKSKLSDQSEELINFLHDLIKYNGKEF
jgi:hypothetical protein